MKRIVTIGNIIKDLFLHHDATSTLSLCCQNHKEAFLVLEEGKKIELSSLEQYVGGGAANSAVSCARLGNHVQLFAKMGIDRDADFLIQSLTKELVDTKLVVQSNNDKTGVSFILPCPSGNRTILMYRGSNSCIKESDVPQNIFEKTDGVYISSLSGDSAQLLPLCSKKAKKNQALVALNPGSTHLAEKYSFILQALNDIDIFIVNRMEAHTILSLMQTERTCTVSLPKKIECPSLLVQRESLSQNTCFDLQTFFKKLHTHGPAIIVVTNSADGVYVSDKKKIYFHKTLSVPIVSTVGAGDAFGSTFFSYLVNNYPIEQAIQAGMLNSSAVIQQKGAQTGLLHKKVLDSLIKTIDQSLLKKF